MDSLSTVLDHWRPIAMVSAAVAAIRVGYRLAISIAVAPWERDQLRAQVRILETKISSLEDLIDGPGSGGASSAHSSVTRGSTQTRTRRTPHSSSKSTG